MSSVCYAPHMATGVISYATEIWLAELAAAGWTLTVSERRTAIRSLPTQDDEFEPMTLLMPVVRAGVLATCLEDGREGSGIFVPCESSDAAFRLLERVEAETAA